MEIYIVRHGSTQLNEEEKLRGWIDVPLSDYGIEQSARLVDYFLGKRIDKIYSSDLRRSMQTAEIIGRAIGLPVYSEYSLRPINFGELQGKPMKEIIRDMNQLMNLWKFDPNLEAPHGESFRVFQERAFSFINAVIDEIEEKECVILVTHARFCMYAAQLIINKLLPLKGDDLERLNTIDIEPGNFLKIERWEPDKVVRITCVNPIEEDEPEEIPEEVPTEEIKTLEEIPVLEDVESVDSEEELDDQTPEEEDQEKVRSQMGS